jgi:hypothetical protein
MDRRFWGMKIFLRKIPLNTTCTDLRHFAEPLLGPRWYAPFREGGEVQGCQILEVLTTRGYRIEMHGVLDIEPARVAAVTMLRLNGRKLNGQVIEVRPWISRSEQRDRRRSPTWARVFDGAERRRHDRRRADCHVHIGEMALGAPRVGP